MHPLNPNTTEPIERLDHCYCCKKPISVWLDWQDDGDGGCDLVPVDEHNDSEWRMIEGRRWCVRCVGEVAARLDCDIETVLWRDGWLDDETRAEAGHVRESALCGVSVDVVPAAG